MVKDYFTSTLFRKVRQWAEAHKGVLWRVVVPPMGLVEPSRVVWLPDLWEDKGVVDPRRVALVQVKDLKVSTIWMLCGKSTWQPLLPYLEGYKLYCPLRNLRIGEQMQWLERTMEIDLKELEAEIEAMSEAEVHEAVLSIARTRANAKGQTSEAQKERAKHEKAVAKLLMEKLASGEITLEEL